jgi:hypothetical protein
MALIFGFFSQFGFWAEIIIEIEGSDLLQSGNLQSGNLPCKTSGSTDRPRQISKNFADC